MIAPSSSLVVAIVALAALSTPASAKPGPPVTPPFCGNERVEADRGEICDGSNLNGEDCTTIGFDGGSLSCGSNCQHVTNACTTCDNGLLETGEACDGNELRGHTCRSETGFGFGELGCSATCDGFDTSDCRRYESDGQTVTDSVTGLMWQRTTDDGTITDKDNQYSWTLDDTFFPPPNGSAFTDFLATLNGIAATPVGSTLHTFQSCDSDDPTQPQTFCSRGPACFAGYCDWRLPESHELLSIVDGSRTPRAIDEELFGPIDPDTYWTATICSFSPREAWAVVFFDGGSSCSETSRSAFPGPGREPVLHPARAVRYVGDRAP